MNKSDNAPVMDASIDLIKSETPEVDCDAAGALFIEPVCDEVEWKSHLHRGDDQPGTQQSLPRPKNCTCLLECKYHDTDEKIETKSLRQQMEDELCAKLSDDRYRWVVSAQTTMGDYVSLAQNPRAAMCRKRTSISAIIKCPFCTTRKHGSPDRLLHVMNHIMQRHASYSDSLLYKLVQKNRMFVAYARSCVMADLKYLSAHYSDMY